VQVLAFVATKSHAQFESALLKMKASLEMFGHKQPQIFYTDNPVADKQFLENIFPSLTENVIPVEKYPTLKAIELLPPPFSDSSARHNHRVDSPWYPSVSSTG